jgi:hypothetical protein
MTDPSGSAKTLALPAGFDAPRLLRYDDVTAHAITRDDPAPTCAASTRVSTSSSRSISASTRSMFKSKMSIPPRIVPGHRPGQQKVSGSSGRVLLVSSVSATCAMSSTAAVQAEQLSPGSSVRVSEAPGARPVNDS